MTGKATIDWRTALRRPIQDEFTIAEPEDLDWAVYRSIKMVRAAKIVKLNHQVFDRNVIITVEARHGVMEERFANLGWMRKHEPEVGGYIVVYDNDYVSYSPSVPFEKGHIRLDTPAGEPDRSNHAMLRREVQAIASQLGEHFVIVGVPVKQMLLNAIAMYGEPEPPELQLATLPDGTVDDDCARLAKLTSKIESAFLVPQEHLGADLDSSFLELVTTGMTSLVTGADAKIEFRDPDHNVENEFHNWAVSHGLLRDGHKPHATVMQAYDELLDKCDELEKRLAARNLSWAEVCVLTERQRQIVNEGHQPEGDDTYQNNELAKAAGCYLLYADAYPNASEPPTLWPWNPAAYKPKGYRQNLVRAAALILAELDSVDRKSVDWGTQPDRTVIQHLRTERDEIEQQTIATMLHDLFYAPSSPVSPNVAQLIEEWYPKLQASKAAKAAKRDSEVSNG